VLISGLRTWSIPFIFTISPGRSPTSGSYLTYRRTTSRPHRSSTSLHESSNLYKVLLLQQLPNSSFSYLHPFDLHPFHSGHLHSGTSRREATKCHTLRLKKAAESITECCFGSGYYRYVSCHVKASVQLRLIMTKTLVTSETRYFFVFQVS
jgi:hypothetical protein